MVTMGWQRWGCCCAVVLAAAQVLGGCGRTNPTPPADPPPHHGVTLGGSSSAWRATVLSVERVPERGPVRIHSSAGPRLRVLARLDRRLRGSLTTQEPSWPPVGEVVELQYIAIDRPIAPGETVEVELRVQATWCPDQPPGAGRSP